MKILELACGTGRLAKQLLQTFPNTIITGTDITPDMINLAKTLVNPVHDTEQLTWEVAYSQALPFGDGSFDFIFVHMDICQLSYCLYRFFSNPCNMFDHDVTKQLLENAHFQDVGLTSVSIHTGYPNKAKASRSMVEGTPLSNSLIQNDIDLQTFKEGAKNVYDIYQQTEGSELELDFDMYAILTYGRKRE